MPLRALSENILSSRVVLLDWKLVVPMGHAAAVEELVCLR